MPHEAGQPLVWGAGGVVMPVSKTLQTGPRIVDHPILGTQDKATVVGIVVDGRSVRAREGEMLAAALMAAGIRVFHYSTKRKEPRGVFCAVGRCTDCVMIVDGVPNVRTCVTPVRAGMVVQTQHGLGHWGDQNESR